MNILKIVVTGDFSSGKTQFIKTISEHSFSTEKQITESSEILKKDTTTVAMDYGKLCINGKTIHLFGTPGQDRFKFMWEVLDKNKSAFILLVDSTNIQNIKNAKKFLDFFGKEEIPYIVGCNKQDLKDALSVEEIKKILNIDAVFMPLVAKDKNSALNLVKNLLNQIQPVFA